jgi:hypothetical protein
MKATLSDGALVFSHQQENAGLVGLQAKQARKANDRGLKDEDASKGMNRVFVRSVEPKKHGDIGEQNPKAQYKHPPPVSRSDRAFLAGLGLNCVHHFLLAFVKYQNDIILILAERNSGLILSGVFRSGGW